MTAPLPSSPPRWLSWWLAFLAPFYVISPVALFGLRYLRVLPQSALWLLGIYALSQQIPALFTPEPILASILALCRTALMFGLIGLGAAWRTSRNLQPIALGLSVVFLTALVYSLLGGIDIFVERLAHPYMTPISLGLGGALGIWLALFGQGRLLWRLPLSLLSIGILLLSGSRGPLLAVVVGCAAGFLCRMQGKLLLPLILGLTLLGSGLVVGNRLGIEALTRLSQTDTTGRDVVWDNTESVIRAHPWGVGSYRLGIQLEPVQEQCNTFPSLTGATSTCPEWLTHLGNPWIIAHNLVLQQLAETGPFGLTGLLVLLSAVIYSAIKGRRPLDLAILSGLIVASINDNTILIPSPFFAEAFWIIAGMQLIQLRDLSRITGLGTSIVGLVLSMLLSLPVWGGSLFKQTKSPSPTVDLAFFNAPLTIQANTDYMVFFQVRLPDDQYRAVLRSCKSSCFTMQSIVFWSSQGVSSVLTLQGRLPSGNQTLQLLLLPRKADFSLKPIAQKTWNAEVEP